MVVEELERLGLLIKIEDYSHAVGHCQRCATVIEPLASTQWFVIWNRWPNRRLRL